MLKPTNEKDRLEALLNYKILDTLPEEQFDRLTALASSICKTPISLITLLDDHRQWFKSKVGLEVAETPVNQAFCRFTILGDELLEIEDAQKDDRFVENPLVTSNPNIRFYAGYPLIDKYGNALGALCVIDRVPKKLDKVQKKSLKLLAEIVIELIQDRRNLQELKYFEKLFTLSNDLICIAGTDGFFKKVNPSFSVVLGWDESYILNTTFFELIHPDDILKTEEEINKLSTGVPTVNFTHRFRCKDGSYKYLQWVATPEVSTGYIFAIARDLTLEKQKEILISDSEHNLKVFFENSQGFMCTHDLDGKFITVNSSGSESLGYNAEEISKMSLYEIVPAKYQYELSQYFKVILKNGVAKGLMHTLHKNGELRIWLFSNVLEKDAFGNQFIIGNAIDITDRYKLEADLKRSNEMLEQTNKVARIGSWEMNLENSKIYWSEVTKAIHGVLSNYVPDFESAISFYEGLDKDIITDAVDKAIQHGLAFDFDLKIKPLNIDPIWVRAIGTPEFKDGICTRLYGTFQDIDEKKKADQSLLNKKERLTAFVDHTPAAVAMLDVDLNYIAVSKRWTEEYNLLGINIIGTPHFDMFPNLTEDWKVNCFNSLKGEIIKNEEHLSESNGTTDYQYLSWEIRPWYKFDDSIGGIMIFTQDITKSVLLRKELKAAKILAEEGSLAKSEFLANMSHEIRTPLNGVIGFTDLVLKTDLNATQQQYLSIVNQSANSLLQIINDILDFSKIEAGKLELSIDKTDLYEISSQAVDIICFQIQNKGIELLLNISVDLPRFIWVDALRLKQVLVNLLGNAVKFTQKGEIELKITSLSKPNDNEIKLRFEVRDTGIGIHSDKLNKIFEAFSQEDSSTTKKYGGTGLGLTISNKLLGLMDSKMQLISSFGKGSTFYFDLQLKMEYNDPIQWENIDQIKKILIVDDNENNRLVLKQMLLLKNISVEEAKDGLEAIQMLSKNNDFNAVIMDYHMPILDGLETIRKVRSHIYKTAKELPIILLHSSADDQKILKSCIELEITNQLVKPVKIYELYQALERIHKKEEIFLEVESSNEVTVTTQIIKVLVVEDNVVNKLLAKTILKRIAPQAEIIEASDGVEGVELFKNLQPDIVFMDIQMPVMNGYEATEKIRAISSKKHVPIIALTAANVKGEKEKCLALGMDDFLSKPFVEESFASIFQKWMLVSIPTKDLNNQKLDNLALDDHFNIEAISDFIDDDQESLKEILNLVLKGIKEALPIIKQQIFDGNLTALNASGHKLYGTSSSCGLNILAEIARELENLETLEGIKPNMVLDKLVSEIILVSGLIGDFTNK